jgi:ABC-2 type transport system ATP-binding protein
LSVLSVSHLRKHFGSVRAVEDISFEVEAGEIFTIIGPNGAGKTTTLEMVEGLVPPDGGTITYGSMTWEKNADEIKMKIGVQPQSGALFDLLTVEENMKLFSTFYSKQRPVDEILNIVNLTEHRRKLVKNLSGGQRQRLAIGLAMINDPEILFLDEPTTGLDPQARRNIWDIVRELKQLGKTVILTTHYMEEAETLSDRVCIVDQGRVVTMDTPAALIGRLTREREVRLTMTDGTGAAAEVERHLRELSSVMRVEREGKALRFWSVQPEESIYDLIGFARDRGYSIEQMSIREMSLEDVFIAFTGKEWRD